MTRMTGDNPYRPPADGDLFRTPASNADDARSMIAITTALAPHVPIDAANPYPRPWYYWWDAPVWRVSSTNRTIVATCTDESCAKQIVEWGNK